MRKKSKNKIEWREITPDIKAKILKGFFKEKRNQSRNISGEKRQPDSSQTNCKQGEILIGKRACRPEFLAKKSTRVDQLAKTPQNTRVRNMLDRENKVPGKFSTKNTTF